MCITHKYPPYCVVCLTGPTSIVRILPQLCDGNAGNVSVKNELPVLSAKYNQYVGGTDLCDQRRGKFTTQRRSKKWWHALFYFTLDVLMVGKSKCTHEHKHKCTHTCIAQ